MHRSPATLTSVLLSLALVALALPACAANRATHDDDVDGVAPDGLTMDGDDIDSQAGSRVEEMMQGRFPGVRVIPMPGGGISVRVWAGGQMVGNHEPLYVVDGTPYWDPGGRGLAWLNPGDIATIRVLKDISETAAYGVRGGNGVVLITTRKGDDDS